MDEQYNFTGDEADVVVIGAGVVGGAIAYYLSKMGKSVIILEQDEVASGASGGNNGQISIIDREPGIELEWAAQSMEMYREFEKAGEFDCDLDITGGLALFYNEEEIKIGRKVVSKYSALGYDCSMLIGDEIKKQEPNINTDIVMGAAYCGEEGRLNPFSITIGLVDMAVSRGARLYQKTKVIDFILEGNIIKGVLTDKGSFKGDNIVIATGAWTRELMSLLGLDYRIFYGRGTLMVTNPVDKCIRGPIVPGCFAIGTLYEGDWNLLGLTQHKNGTITIGQDTRAVTDYDKGVSYDGIKGLARAFANHFPTLKDLDIVRVWSAVTPHVEDSMPIFGYSGKYPNMFIAAGLKGALTIAPAAGRTAARIIVGETDDNLVADYSPTRFE